MIDIHPTYQAIIVTFLTVIGVLGGAYWKSRQHPPDAAAAITNAANSLIEQFRATNDALRAQNEALSKRIGCLEIRLDDCLAKHKAQEVEIDTLQAKIRDLQDRIKNLEERP